MIVCLRLVPRRSFQNPVPGPHGARHQYSTGVSVEIAIPDGLYEGRNHYGPSLRFSCARSSLIQILFARAAPLEFNKFRTAIVKFGTAYSG